MTRVPESGAQIPLPFPSPHLDFRMYWPGANREACETLGRTAEGLETHTIYLWGGSGTGKTHLLHAACNAASTGGRRSALVPLGQAADFVPGMLDGLEQVDVVCVDDVDRIGGVARWEVALFNLFNRVREAGGSILLAARSSPSASPVSLPDLRSRLIWDLVYHLRPLDEVGRYEALQHRARRRGMCIPDEVLEFLSRRISRDPHTLFTWLERLDRESLAARRRLSVPFVRELLEREKLV